MEQTCILVKPDALCSKHVGQIVQRFEAAGLRLLGLKMLRLSYDRAAQFYAEHQGKSFYPGLMTFMTSAPIVAMAWEGPHAISLARKLLGATDSSKAEAGTIRKDFGTDNRFNAVHGSDSATSSPREIAFFFKSDELHQYTETDWRDRATVSN